MKLSNLFAKHYLADDPPAGGGTVSSSDPESRARFSQRDVNEIVGREKSAAAARVEEQYKVKLEAIAKERDAFKSDYEKAKSTLTELEPLKEVAKQHEVLLNKVRENDIERSLIEHGCDPKRARHTRVLLAAENAIPEGEIADWKPTIEKAKEIFPIAFGTADNKPPTGGTPNGGKPAGGEKKAVDPVEAMRNTMLGKGK